MCNTFEHFYFVAIEFFLFSLFIFFYFVVCLAHAVRWTSLISSLRFGTFSLVVRVIKLGVADAFREFVMLPHSSITLNVKSGIVTRLSFFRMVPLLLDDGTAATDAAIDVDDTLDGNVFSRDSDNDADTGSDTFNFPSDVNMFMLLPYNVADIGRIN